MNMSNLKGAGVAVLGLQVLQVRSAALGIRSVSSGVRVVEESFVILHIT